MFKANRFRNPFFFNYEANLEELGKTNKIFQEFDTLSEVKEFLFEITLKKENIKISENLYIKDDEDEEIILQIKYFLFKKSKSINLTLKKIITNEKNMIKYLTKLLNMNKKQNSFINLYDSKLITNYNQIKLIKTGIKNNDNIKNIKLNLLFRATRDGDIIKTFHDKVDGISPTISLIQTKNNYIFGGFTDHAWDDKSGCVPTNNTFMFSFNKNKIYIGKNGGYIHCSSDSGPWFCNGAGVYLDNYFKTKNSYQWELKTNNNYFDGFNEQFELVGGTKFFEVNEVEVFKVEYI